MAAPPSADELIDAILAEKGPAVYKDGLSEDNWEEELEQIPLFMTKSPDPATIDKSPGLAALQEIKYQEETPEGRATVLKEDGNEMFKKKKYRDAIDLYTEALAEKPSDTQLTAVLYCNRAAAHYYIGNYRSSITDASHSKSIKPDHIKAFIKGAESTFKLEKYQETINWCEEGLKVDTSCQKLLDLKKKAAIEKIRGVRLASSNEGYRPVDDDDDDKLLELLVPQAPTGCVRFDDSDGSSLVWPVLFLYPEYGTSDLIESFNEHSKFIDHISVMFGYEEEVLWDHENKYKPDAIEVWYEDYSTGHYVNVPVESSLSDIINHSSQYVVVCGSPAFFLLVRGSLFQRTFLANK